MEQATYSSHIEQWDMPYGESMTFGDSIDPTVLMWTHDATPYNPDIPRALPIQTEPSKPCYNSSDQCVNFRTSSYAGYRC